jgi:hypothetical protein
MDHKPEALRVRMLGGFSVSVGSRVLEENAWRLKNAAALVKLLALAPGHRLHRDLRATKLFGAAEALGEAVDSQHMPEEDAWREPYLAAARSRLDETTWDKAWAEGRAMSLEQAIDYALSEHKPLIPSSPESEKSS